MNILRLIIPVSLLFTLMMSSCYNDFTTVKEIDLPKHEKKLAVFSHLAYSNCDIFISHSKGIDDTLEYKVVKANVSILKNGNDYFDFVYPDDLDNGTVTVSNSIELPDKIKKGENYTIIVESDEFGTAKSSLIVPDIPEVNDILYTEDYYIEDYDTLDKLEFNIKDNGSEVNFYLINVYPTFYKIENSNLHIAASTDEPLVKEIRQDFNSSFILTDKTFNGQNKNIILKIQSFSFNTPDEDIPVLDTINLNVKAITKDYYNFLLSKIQYEESQGNPFAEPVNIFNNIENGYGLFSSDNSVIKTIKIK